MALTCSGSVTVPASLPFESRTFQQWSFSTAFSSWVLQDLAASSRLASQSRAQSSAVSSMESARSL